MSDLIKPETNIPLTVRAKYASVREGQHGDYLSISGRIGAEEGSLFLPSTLVNDLTQLGVLTGEVTRRKSKQGVEYDSLKVVWPRDGLSVPFVLCKREGENNKKYYTAEAADGTPATKAENRTTTNAPTETTPTPYTGRDEETIAGVLALYDHLHVSLAPYYTDERATQAGVATVLIQLQRLGITTRAPDCAVCGAPGGTCPGCVDEAGSDEPFESS
jgi:hypothetical protein